MSDGYVPSLTREDLLGEETQTRGYVPTLSRDELLGDGGQLKTETYVPGLSHKSLMVDSGGVAPEEYDRQMGAFENSKNTSLLSAAYTGLKQGTGQLMSDGQKMILNVGRVGTWDTNKQRYRTMEDVLEDERASDKPFLTNSAKIIDYGDGVAENNYREYEPYSGAWLASNAGSMAPTAAGLALTTGVAMRTGKADVLRSAGQFAAGRSGLGATGATIAGEAIPAAAIGAATAVPESMIEAQQAREEAIQKGLGETKADEVFRNVLGNNIVWNAGLNTFETLTSFGRFPVKVSPRVAASVRFGGAATQEGVQELGQYGIAQKELTGEYNLGSDEAKQNFVLGAMGGTAFGAGGYVSDMISPSQNNVNFSKEGYTPSESLGGELQYMLGMDSTEISPNESRNTSPDINSFVRAISGQESGGDSEAVNAHTGAYGEFQIMEPNWASWAREAGISPDAPRTRENQNIIAKNKMMQYYNEFGSWRDVAIAWYAGPGAVGWSQEALSRPQHEYDANGNVIATYPSINEYADSIVNRMGGDIISDGSGTYQPANTDQQKQNELGYHEQQTYDFTKDDLPDFGELKKLTPESVHESVVEDTRNFSAQLDQWEKGELGNRNPIRIGKTPELLGLIGAKQLPLEISQNVLKKVVYEKHGIGLDTLKQLPAQIADPWFVFESKTKDNSLVVFTTLKDQNDREIMAAIHLDTQHGLHQVNAIASTYGRNNTQAFIMRNLKENKTRYVNTKKNQEMVTTFPATIAGEITALGSSSNILTEKDLTFNKENLAGQNPQNVKFNKSYMPGGIYDGMNYNESQTDGKTVSRRDIMDRITNFMGIPIRYGRLGPIGRKAKGWHDGGRGLIRVGERFDWDTITHEIGHHVDQKLGGVSSNPKHHAELSKWVRDLFGDSYAKEDLASEGVAEFFRQYLTNHEKAKENFPGFYKEMDSRLKRNPKVLAELKAIKEDFDIWRNQSSEDRVAGSISFDEKSKIPKSLSDVANAAIEFGQKSYDGWVEQFEPLNRLEKEIERITGKKLPEHLKIFEKARLYRGWAGKFATTISDGVNGKGTSLKSVMQLVKGKEKEFSSYLVALREENASYIEANDPEVKYSYTLSSQDRKATLSKYNSSETFQKARELLRKYNNEQLDMLVEAGMKKQEDVDYLKSKWPDYVPFYRDFSSEAEVDSFIGAGKNLVNIGDPINHKFKGSQRDIINPIESIVKNTFVFTQRAEANKVGRTLLELSQMQGMGHLIEEVPGSTDAKEGIISVWVKGEKKMFQVAPDIYNALMGLQAESSGFIAKIISKGEMVVRLSSTILEPAFAITNTMRDTVTAFINAEHGFIPIVDNINGFMSFWRKDKHFTEWMNSGGANSQMVALDRNEIKKALNELRSDAFWENLNWEKAKYYLTYISEASEVSTRLGVYKKAREKGASIHKAALESRDVTLDFARSGKTARSMKIAFFGAWIQGLDKINRSFKEHPGRTSARVAQILVAPSAILFLAQHDDERWKELQRRDKDRFWYIIPSAFAGNKMSKAQFDALLASGKSADQILKELEESGDMIKIPKPQSIGLLFASGTERTLDWMKNDNPKAFTDYASSVWSDLAPNIMPMIAKIPLEWGSNYSFFRDRDIVGQGVKERPNWLQYDRNTSELSKKAGELTKGLGPLEISPMQLDNAVRNMGSLFGTGLQVSDLVLGADNKKPTAKLPEYYGAKRVMQGSFSSPQSVSDFYTDLRTQSKLEEEFDMTGERPDSFDPGYLKQLKMAEKQIKLLNKHEAGFRDSPTLTADQKRKEIDKIQLKKLELARKVVR